jgi:hypothetical protein
MEEKEVLQTKNLFALLLLSTSRFGYSFPAIAAPVHACTFYKSIWAPHFMACAEPLVEPLSCKKVKYAGPVRMEYKGDYVSMFLPDYVIEVTDHWGKSMFSETSPTMGLHLQKAKGWYESKAGIPGLGTGAVDKGGANISGRYHFWHARTLPVPYGGFNKYPDVAGAAGGHMLPVCYSGISEYYPAQWNLGLADLKFTVAWAPIGIPMCHTDAGIFGSAAVALAKEGAKKAANSILAELGAPIDVSDFSFQASCAYPIQTQVGISLNLRPSSDALSLDKLCMGTLGNLLPREGTIETEDLFRSSVMAAWKFASLVKDFHPGSVAGIEATDKWQIMFPKSTRPNCFRAGNLSDLFPGPIEGRSFIATETQEDAYIYAIWRNRGKCLEPGQGQLWRTSVQLEHQALSAICSGVN